MQAFDKIASRDNAQFPFADFMNHGRLLAVDWRAAEDEILDAFFRATGLPNSDASLEWDAAAQHMKLRHQGQVIPVARGAGVSAQHSMLRALQKVHEGSHSIRYLNHVAAGNDTAFFVVETTDAWRRLEQANPHVRWFFTPIDLLPDVFESSPAELTAAGSRYANA